MSASLDLILAGGSALCALQYALGLGGEEWGGCVLLWDGNEGVAWNVKRSVEG